jgi:phosphorylcholine metabolism protein LicD
LLSRILSYFGGGSNAVGRIGPNAKNVDILPWHHGENRKYECFGDDLILKVDDQGLYKIIESRYPALDQFVGRRISVGSRRVTSTLTTLVRSVDDLLTQHDIPHWINSGTLLGTWRQGAVVPWDNDADMMIRAQDAERVLGLQEEFEASGYLFTSNKLFGPTYKMYVKSAETPKIMVELCSMHPHDVHVAGVGADILWTYHAKMVEAVKNRIERIYAEDPTNEIARHRYNQRLKNDILIDNQYLSREIFPLQRLPFGTSTISGPAHPEIILHRDYGVYGLTHGLISCACQWTDGDYLLKVEICPLPGDEN